MKMTTPLKTKIHTVFERKVMKRHATIFFLKNSPLCLFVTCTRRDISYSIYKKNKNIKRLEYKYIFFLLRKKPALSYKVDHQRTNNFKSSCQPSRVFFLVVMSGREVILKDMHVASTKAADKRTLPGPRGHTSKSQY